MKTSPPNAVAAVCGLYCAACSFYIGSHEEPERLAGLAARFGRSVDAVYCDGCRSERRTFYCETCSLFRCAAGRGLDFCSECSDYPCADLKAFQEELPHRAELWNSLETIRTRGWRVWEEEMQELYACPGCGIINSAYDVECRACGHTPGSRFAQRHGDAVRALFAAAEAEDSSTAEGAHEQY
jgi:hypothetical protein